MRNALKLTAGLAFFASLMPFMWPAAPVVFIAMIVTLFYSADSEVERAYKARDKAEKELSELRYKYKLAELEKEETVLKNEQISNKLNDIGFSIKTALQESRAASSASTVDEEEEINEVNGDSSPFGELVKL